MGLSLNLDALLAGAKQHHGHASHHGFLGTNPWDHVDRHIQRQHHQHYDVPVPYAPTARGAAAAAAARRHPDHLALSALTARLTNPTPVVPAAEQPLISPGLSHTIARLNPLSPEEGAARALGGEHPDPRYQQIWGPQIFGKVQRIAVDANTRHEGIQADPVAEAVIGALAGAGVGGVVSGLTRGGAEAAAGAAGEAAATEGADSSTPLFERLLKGVSNVRTAPERAAQQLASADGRRAAARAATRLSARQARAHPFLSSTGALAAAHGAGVHSAPTDIASALVTGHWDALKNNPVGVAETTGRALAGSIASLAGLGYAGAQSAIEADPHPFLKTAGADISGLATIGGHLLSGDPAEVQKAVEDEAGLSFLVPVPALRRFEGARIPLTDTHVPGYPQLRSAVRDFAKRRREGFEDVTGFPMRHGPGEQHVFGALERRAQRRAVSEALPRNTLGPRLIASKIQRDLAKEARKIPGARSLRNIRGIEPADLVSTIAEYGLKDEQSVHTLRRLGPAADSTLPGDVNLHAVLDELERRPELLHDPHLQKLVQTYRDSTETLPLQKMGRGGRAAALPQGELFGILDPKERVPMGARRFTSAHDRAGAWKDLRDSEKAAKGLRTEARLLAAQSITAQHEAHGVATGLDPRPGQLRTAAEAKYREARALEDHNNAFRRELHPYSRPGAAASSRARRKLWDPSLVREYQQEVHAKAAEHGMQPGVYTHHTRLREEGEKIASARGGNKPTRVQHVRRADEHALAARDAVDRSFGALLDGSVLGPRVLSGLRKFARDTFSKNAVKLKNGEGKLRVTEEQFSQAIRDGEISSKHYVWVPDSEIKQAYIDPAVDPKALGDVAQRRLKGELTAEDIAKQKQGAKGVVVPKEVYEEYAAQINPRRYLGETVVNAISKTAGRTLLFSPAWVLSQVVAEGLPIIMAHPRLLFDPTYIARLQHRLSEFNKIDHEQAMSFAAVMGEAPVRAATPRELQTNFKPEHSHFYNAARAIEHNPIGKALFSTVRMRPLVLFDQWRQGKYRQILAAAEADKRFNGFTSGLQGALHTEKRLSDELRHLDPVDQLRALSEPRYARELDHLQGYVEDVLGNWTAFSRYERQFAPFAVFYGFIRYAFRWPFTFAAAHPVSAMINYFLAQQNAEQIEKMLHGKPAEFYQYANPVVHDAEGNASWLPGGSRIAPGLSAPAQGLLSGGLGQATVGATNPAYAALIGLVTGENSFGGHDESEEFLGGHWSLAAQELMTTPPVLRLFGVGQSDSPTAQRLRELDPQRQERSFLAPWLPQSASEAKQSNDLLNALNAGGGQTSSSSSSLNPWDSVAPSGESTNPWDSVKIE